MADSIRSRSELAAILADNTLGEISAQDLRDLLATALGCYGSLLVAGGAVAQAVSAAPALLTAWALAGPAAGVLAEQPDSRLTVPVGGVYEVHGCFSVTGDGAAATYGFVLRQGGAATNVRASTRLSAGEVRCASFAGQVTCVANDLLTVYAEADAARNLTVIDGSFTARLIG